MPSSQKPLPKESDFLVRALAVRIADVLQITAVVTGKGMVMNIPVTAQLWQGSCLAKPATCYVGLLSDVNDLRIQFVLMDQRTNPDWSSIQFTSETLEVKNVNSKPINQEMVRFDISVRLSQKSVTRHRLMAHRHGCNSRPILWNFSRGDQKAMPCHSEGVWMWANQSRKFHPGMGFRSFPASHRDTH